MADDKLKAGPESPGEGSVGDAQTVTKPPVPETVEEPAAGTGPVRQPEQSVTPGMGGDVPAQPAPQVEADKVEKSPDQDKKVEPEEKTAKRRGRPPKEQDSPQGDKPEKGPEPRTGRPAKADKAARGKSPSPALDKVSRGKEQELTPAQRGGKTRRERNQNVKDFLAGKRETPFADGKQPPKSTKGAPVKEAEAPAPEIKLPPTPEVPPRPVEQGKIVYLKLSELHPFHTLRDHPFKVQDDKAMDDLVGTIKEHGIMTPATVRPEKDGKGYEIIAGHRRCHGGERAGLDEIPCIVREMTDLEAVREMKNSNKQRGDPLPSELAKLLDLELEAIKRQGARPKNDKEAEALGKLSVEIVGKEHDMNYKKVLRYPYVWGGSSPATSFDCSGFVSWVINHSGWDVGRLGAQGLYNICTPTSAPRPGDLVFFEGTYDTSGVSHCGIYVGDGMMIHAGDPISYANLNTSYWQSHFYAYGRLP